MSNWAKKRFWKTALAEEQEAGFAILLDGRSIKTPARATLVVPSKKLADEIVIEWQAQGDIIDPMSMPFTRTSNAALDKVTHQLSEVQEHMAEYGETDLLCYRANSPQELVDRQVAAWDPLLAWSKYTFDAPLNIAQGVMYVAQPAQSLANLKAQMTHFSAFELSGIYDLVCLSGSLVAALAVVHKYKAATEVWDLCRVDEFWQQEQWGVDEEAQATESAKRSEFLHANNFLATLGCF